jgi:hypothetical protein
MRYEHEKFIYQAPKDSDNAPVAVLVIIERFVAQTLSVAG